MRPQQPVLRRGMPIRRQGTQSQCAVGPFFTGAPGNYCLTVEHGIGGIGNSRVVEANLDGFNWVRVGEYVTGVQNDKVDWAVVHLDDDVVIDAAPPFQIIADPLVAQQLPDKAVGVGYSHQAHGPIVFESGNIRSGNLDGKVDGSPTILNQFLCITNPGARRADEGVSGMAVYDKAGAVLGIEWAIEWNGPQQRHTFYVQPITAVVISFAETINALDDRYRNSRAPALVWGLAKPLADAMQEDVEERRKHAETQNTPELKHPKFLFGFIQRNIE
jgi:hypothetical protein